MQKQHFNILPSNLHDMYSLTDTHIWSAVTRITSCLPTSPCLFGGVLPYFEVMGHPVTVSSLGFKCPECFIWNCSYIVYLSKMKGQFRDNWLRYYYLWLAFLMAGWVEGIRRAIVLGLVLTAGAATEQASSVGPRPLCSTLSSVDSEKSAMKKTPNDNWLIYRKDTTWEAHSTSGNGTH